MDDASGETSENASGEISDVEVNMIHPMDRDDGEDDMETEVPLCLPPPPENLCFPPPPEYTAVFMQYHGLEGFVHESHCGQSEPHPRSGQALVPRNEAFPEGDVDPALLSLSVKMGEMQTREQALEVGVHAELDSLPGESSDSLSASHVAQHLW